MHSATAYHTELRKQFIHTTVWTDDIVFVWFDSLRPINNISVIWGRIFLGLTSTKLGLMFLLKDTTQWRQWGSNPRPLGLGSSTLQMSHCTPWTDEILFACPILTCSVTHQLYLSKKWKTANLLTKVTFLNSIYMSCGSRFPTMWYVRPAKSQTSLRKCAVWSEPLLVACIFYECLATDWTTFGVSKLKRRLHRLVWVHTCQNATMLEITCHSSIIKIRKFFYDYKYYLQVKISIGLNCVEWLHHLCTKRSSGKDYLLDA